jgi:hypothetical protein
MEGLKLFVQDYRVVWAEPVHTVVDHLGDWGMPSRILWHHVGVIHEVCH